MLRMPVGDRLQRRAAPVSPRGGPIFEASVRACQATAKNAHTLFSSISPDKLWPNLPALSGGWLQKEGTLLKLRWFAVMVVGLLAGSGVAAADPVNLPDVAHPVDTGDGYHLSASLTNMEITSVPNMAATAFTREAFFTATATETFYGGKEPATGDAQLELLIVMGCQVNQGPNSFLSLTGPQTSAAWRTSQLQVYHQQAQ